MSRIHRAGLALMLSAILIALIPVVGEVPPLMWLVIIVNAFGVAVMLFEEE